MTGKNTIRAGIFTKLPPQTAIVLTTIATGGVWFLILRSSGITIYLTIGLALIDALITFLLLEGLTYFFAQFVLPIQKQKDRIEIYKRVRDFASGKRGPAIFIKNRQIIEQKNEKDNKGPGVIWLDTASAAVLRTDIEFIRTIGPGVSFTKVHKINDDTFHEYLAGSVDLRVQWILIGPMANDQPFLNPPPLHNPKDYIANKDRQQETSGWTRDGFEVSPTFSIKFRVKQSDNTQANNEVISHYGFDPVHVNNAIIHEPMELDKQTRKKELMKWRNLPAHLVVNLWREYIRKFKMEDLFISSSETSALQIIESKINERTRTPKHTPLDDEGGPIAGFFISAEYAELHNHGIEIIEIRIHSVILTPDAEKRITEQWSNEWLKAEKTKENLLNKYEASIEALAQKKAIKNFSILASKNFSITTSHTDKYTTLKALIEHLIKSFVSENTENEEIKKIREKLDSVWEWLLSNSKER